MKKETIILFLLLLSNLLLAQKDLQYVSNRGVMIENHPNDTIPISCTRDNVIYTPSKVFYWDYYYSKADTLYRFECLDIYSNDKWKLVPMCEKADRIAQFAQSIVYDSTVLNKVRPARNQSCLQYTYFDTLPRLFPARSYTGLVENPKNIWLHPPRTFLFRILELNPFPYIKFPIKKGFRWNWKLTIGSQWGDTRWKEWEGAITNRYTYRIIDTSYQLQTEMGVMECAVVEATAKSRIGKTKALFYFSPKFGFLRYEFVNIDGSTIVMFVTKIEEK